MRRDDDSHAADRGCEYVRRASYIKKTKRGFTLVRLRDLVELHWQPSEQKDYQEG